MLAERSGIHIVMVTSYQLTHSCVNHYYLTSDTFKPIGPSHEPLICSPPDPSGGLAGNLSLDRTARELVGIGAPAPRSCSHGRSRLAGCRAQSLGRGAGDFQAVLAPLGARRANTRTRGD